MSDARHVSWLRRQVPDLLAEGVLSEEVSRALLERFPEPESVGESRGRRLATVAIGILAAALVGSGVILLLAHNWEELSRAARTVVALAPLILTQLLAFWVLLRGKSAGSRESVGVLWTFAIGAGMALVEQTYHLDGEPEGLLLRWTILALPVCYLMRSTAVALLCAGGITAWVPLAYELAGSGRSNWSMALLLALLPFVVWRLHEARGSVGTTVLGWALPIALGTVLFSTLLGLPAPLMVLMTAVIFAAFIAIDMLWSGREFGVAHRPWLVAGRLSIVVLLIGLSFEGPLSLLGDLEGVSMFEFASGTAPLLLVVAGLVALCWRRRRELVHELPWLCVPLGLAVALVVGESPGGSEGLYKLLVNLMILALGASGVVAGFRRDSLVQLNFGMGVLSLLAVVRFFDSGIDFTVRGIAFIVVGLMFFFLNLALVRKRRVA